MSDTIIERAAKALAKAQSGVDVYDALDEGMQDTLRENVRAVVEAMREPSERMAKAGAADMPGNTTPPHVAETAWQAMIDAALAE